MMLLDDWSVTPGNFHRTTQKSITSTGYLPRYTNGIQDAVLYNRTFVKLREVVLTYSISVQGCCRDCLSKRQMFLLSAGTCSLFTKVPYMDPDGYNDLDSCRTIIQKYWYKPEFKILTSDSSKSIYYATSNDKACDECGDNDVHLHGL